METWLTKKQYSFCLLEVLYPYSKPQPVNQLFVSRCGVRGRYRGRYARVLSPSEDQVHLEQHQTGVFHPQVSFVLK